MSTQPHTPNQCVRECLFLILVAISGMLAGCSFLVAEYRDARLALGFEYPRNWQIISQNAVDGQTELEFTPNSLSSTWVNITIQELGAIGVSPAGAEALLVERIEDRKDVSAKNGGELLSIAQSPATCDSRCCSADGQLVYSWLRDIPSFPERTVELTEDIRVLDCDYRSSTISIMRYADGDPQKERFVRQVMKTFRQIE